MELNFVIWYIVTWSPHSSLDGSAGWEICFRKLFYDWNNILASFDFSVNLLQHFFLIKWIWSKHHSIWREWGCHFENELPVGVRPSAYPKAKTLLTLKPAKSICEVWGKNLLWQSRSYPLFVHLLIIIIFTIVAVIINIIANILPSPVLRT